MPDTYLAGKALVEIGKQLGEDQPALVVTLPRNHLTYSDALAPVVECVRDLTDDRVHLPITDPKRRERLRRLALESRSSLEGDVGSAPSISSCSGSGSGSGAGSGYGSCSTLPLGARPIRTRGLINQEDCPQPASLERRERLRRLALESRSSLEGDVGSAPSISPCSGSGSCSTLPLGARPIRTRGLINQEDCPQPASLERRAALKMMENIDNEHPTPPPHVLQLRAGMDTEGSLAAIVANVTLTAIDHEANMPMCLLRQTQMLWDTSAESTFITTDLLTPEFRNFITNGIHAPYQSPNGTRVQVSLTLEFTNSIVQMEMFAIALPREKMPNQRSGIVLGQRGCIDSLQYRAIPAAVLAAKGQVIDGSFWGDIILEGFVNSDGDYVKVP